MLVIFLVGIILKDNFIQCLNNIPNNQKKIRKLAYMVKMKLVKQTLNIVIVIYIIT